MVVGILMIILGISHLMKSDYFLSKKTKVLLGEEKFKSYQRGLIIPYLYLGTLMICMGIVANMEIPLYILLWALFLLYYLLQIIKKTLVNIGFGIFN